MRLASKESLRTAEQESAGTETGVPLPWIFFFFFYNTGGGGRDFAPKYHWLRRSHSQENAPRDDTAGGQIRQVLAKLEHC